MAYQQAIRAFKVDHALGIHTDITQGNFSSVETMISQAKYAGIDTLRVGVLTANSNWTSAMLDMIVKSDLKLEMLVDTRESPENNAASIARFVSTHPGSVSFVEGPNEPSNWGVSYEGKTGMPGAQAWQEDFYAAMNSNSVTAGITVAGPSSWISSASDVVNIHPYAQHGDQPLAYLQRELSAMAALDPGKGFVVTETGYYTLPGSNPNGVDDATQAKLLLNTYMDAVSLGAVDVGLFALRDWANPDWDSYGLFYGDNNPKPSAQALHNVQSILADAGATAANFTPGSLNYTTTALSDVHSMLMQKSGGEFVLAFWREPDVWDQANMQALTPAGETFSLTLASPATVSVYDPMKGGTAIKTAGGVTSLDLTVVDHPIFIALTPAVETVPASSTATSGAAKNFFGGTVGRDQMTGTAGNDAFYASSGDTMTGGKGDDTYYVVSSNDVVTERSGGGVDTVSTWLANYTLPGQVENLTFTGTGWSTGAGNALNNIIIGNASANTLNGKGGDDRITGGAGNDTFVIANNQGSDIITDFMRHDGGASGDFLSLKGFGAGATLSNIGNDFSITASDGSVTHAILQNVTSLAASDYAFG